LGVSEVVVVERVEKQATRTAAGGKEGRALGNKDEGRKNEVKKGKCIM
jgi:hypothetical protein